MENVLLVLDFLIPLFFFFLGRKLKGAARRALVSSALLVFCLALFVAPLAFLFFSLAAQGIGLACLMCFQFTLIFISLNQNKKALL